MQLRQILNLLVGEHISIWYDAEVKWSGSTADLKNVPSELLNCEVMNIVGYGEMRLIVSLYK